MRTINDHRTTGAAALLWRRIALLAMSMTIGCTVAFAADLKDFTSDGCSLFPDGTTRRRAQWCDCCFAHDIAYWRGGTESERKKADEELRDCVRKRTGSGAMASLMYEGVRKGGHPAFPTWYRWAYGWDYGRGYQPLTDEEQKQVKNKLEEYTGKHPAGYCGERLDKKPSTEGTKK
jgi:hypothetical protein